MKQCPSCAGNCGGTKKTGCKYRGPQDNASIAALAITKSLEPFTLNTCEQALKACLAGLKELRRRTRI